jgi:hypothetical protein
LVDNAAPDIGSFRSWSVAVPRHVVYRAFPSETVLLNLETGRYHGLNTTAGAMLDELVRASAVGEAVDTLAERYSMSHALIERDLFDLCTSLRKRGLIETDDGSDS